MRFGAAVVDYAGEMSIMFAIGYLLGGVIVAFYWMVLS